MVNAETIKLAAESWVGVVDNCAKYVNVVNGYLSSASETDVVFDQLSADAAAEAGRVDYYRTGRRLSDCGPRGIKSRSTRQNRQTEGK